MYVQNEIRTEVFVYFPITPIKSIHKESLYKFLFENVWGERGEVEEDIRLCNFGLENPTSLNEVRYQFGDTYHADEYTDEIAELIKKFTDQWVCINGGYEVVGA